MSGVGAMVGAGKVVGVTGASRFVASWLVKDLLQRGYTVNASVRFSPDDCDKSRHLLALDGAKERLHLFKADLLDYGSFDSCFAGCDGVFHTASPFKNDGDVKDPYADLVVPALYGTCNVHGSIARCPSVKRLVLTSSTAAVTNNGRPRTPTVVVDETWFSDPHFCRESKMWYALSKTLAEKAAWNLVKGKGIADVVLYLLDPLWKSKEEEAEWESVIKRIESIDMVTINPPTVIGPLLQPTLNESAQLILDLINSATYPNASFGWVHVKDVVGAYIRAYENQSAEGRYCLVESVAHYSEIVAILRELCPHLSLPDKCADSKPLVPIYDFSKKKAEEGLGIVNYIPLKDGVRDIVESLKAKKLLL